MTLMVYSIPLKLPSMSKNVT